MAPVDVSDTVWQFSIEDLESTMEYNDPAKQAANQPLGEEVDNTKGITRRSALKMVTVAAATGIAAGSVRPAHALWPTKPTPRFKHVKPHEGGMFTYTVGYPDEEVHWWEGRNIGGGGDWRCPVEREHSNDPRKRGQCFNV